MRRTVYYSITDLGRDVLAKQLEAAEEEWHRKRGADERLRGSNNRRHAKRRGKLSLAEQNLEIRVLRRLAEGEPVKVSNSAQQLPQRCRYWPVCSQKVDCPRDLSCGA